MAGVFLYAVWTLLADFREPMLWALLCSAALRDMKDFLVRFLSDTLSQDRSLFVASWSLLLLPLRSLTGAALDVYRLMAKWRQLAGERDPSHNRVRHFLAAGHKALQRNRECRLTGSQGQPASSSSILFSWLLRAILVQEIYKGARQSWEAGRFVGRAHRAVDRRVHAWLLPQVNSLVSLGLIVALLLGPLLLSSFMAFQIGQEARDVVVSVREAIPQDWSRVTNESRLMRASYIQDLLNKPWVRAYQQQAYALVQKSVPPAVTWLQGRVDDLAEQHNMTQAVHDVRMLYASFQPPMPCTPAEMQAALIAQAKANAALHDAQQLQARLEHDVSLKRNRTAAAVADWRYQQQNWAGDSGTQPPSAGSGRDAGTCQQEAGVGASTQGIGRSGLDAGPKRQTPAGDDASSEGGALWSDAHPLRKAEKAVVTADADLERVEADLGHAKGEVESAADAAAIAGQAVERCERGAQAQLAGPDGPEHQYGNGMQVLVRGIVMELRARLLGILAKLGRLEFGAVLLDVKDMGKEGFTLAKEVVSSSPEGNGARDFSAVQRLAKVAMQPLLSIGQALGKFAMSSLGSTTNVAMSSGRSVFNIGKGAVTWALQFFVFVGLLYFLLNLETDPLCLALHLMPVSEYACHQTRLAMTNALRGVFVSSLKLMIFHSLFTWITLRAAGTHLTYTCTLGTAVFTALPIVPVWVFALPGSLQLALQGNIWGGVLLFLVNFAAGWADDSLLDDIPGSNSYLIGMGVAGGLSTFDNPLQGVLLGPLIISLMSALYNLSASFMDQDSGAQYMQSPVSEPAYANESQPDSNGGAEPGLHASAVNTPAALKEGCLSAGYQLQPFKHHFEANHTFQALPDTVAYPPLVPFNTAMSIREQFDEQRRVTPSPYRAIRAVPPRDRTARMRRLLEAEDLLHEAWDLAKQLFLDGNRKWLSETVDYKWLRTAVKADAMRLNEGLMEYDLPARTLLEFLYLTGPSPFRTRPLDACRQDFDQLLELCPQSANAWHNKAAVAAYAGDHSAAFKAACKAIDMAALNSDEMLHMRACYLAVELLINGATGPTFRKEEVDRAARGRSH
ncbi:hypothetical protein WJX72_005850 [[Myrmecia] bisecta]|uniref:Uncharacterized protein n=1 Tax=[Myrmecia] bisecta TaxID=41462 RepID=A0AAW1PCW1_9CHLO